METVERDGGSTWFSDTRRDLPLVRLRYGGHEMGSYRVSRAHEHEMVVLVGMIRGVISFPIGKTLVIEDMPSVLPRAPATAVEARVVANDGGSMRLAW
jgi:hypothetical protein